MVFSFPCHLTITLFFKVFTMQYSVRVKFDPKSDISLTYSNNIINHFDKHYFWKLPNPGCDQSQIAQVLRLLRLIHQDNLGNLQKTLYNKLIIHLSKDMQCIIVYVI